MWHRCEMDCTFGVIAKIYSVARHEGLYILFEMFHYVVSLLMHLFVHVECIFLCVSHE